MVRYGNCDAMVAGVRRQQLAIGKASKFALELAVRRPGTEQRLQEQPQEYSQVDNIISILIWIRWYRKQILPSVFISGCIYVLPSILWVYFGPKRPSEYP